MDFHNGGDLKSGSGSWQVVTPKQTKTNSIHPFGHDPSPFVTDILKENIIPVKTVDGGFLNSKPLKSRILKRYFCFILLLNCIFIYYIISEKPMFLDFKNLLRISIWFALIWKNWMQANI